MEQKQTPWQATETASTTPKKVQVRDTLAGEVLAHIRIIKDRSESNVIDDAEFYKAHILDAIAQLRECDEDPLLGTERHVAIISLMVFKSKKQEHRNVLWFANEVDEYFRFSRIALQ